MSVAKALQTAKLIVLIQIEVSRLAPKIVANSIHFRSSIDYLSHCFPSTFTLQTQSPEPGLHLGAFAKLPAKTQPQDLKPFYE
jgi:hypothetical protein